MAGYHVSSLKSNEVSANLRSGTFALKWPEDNSKPVTPIAVNLSVDVRGFYLICLNKVTKETECFDTALIHDTRTGVHASLPRGATECEQINIGVLDVPLTFKWLTIYYGNTFIPDRDLRIIHFCFQSPTVAREWAEQLFQYGHNPWLRNLSSLECLEKCHSKLIHSLVDDRFDKKAIPVRNLIQFLCKNTRDLTKETKILKTLDLLELPCRTETVIDPEQFTFDKFVRFYMHLMERHEIDKLFDATRSEIDLDEGLLAILPGGKHRRYLTWEQIRDFIIKQNDARGGAFGTDYYDQKAKDLVKKYTQHDKQFLHKGMYDEAFLRYLLSFDNLIVDPAKFDLFMDMDKPLAHYFIASSHNTYLTGSQITGRASTEMYRQVLLSGCRCVELDVVDSEKKNDEPEITHRNTLVRSVTFVQVITAIRDCAFKTSPYPVILSLENHCGPRAQAKMAQYLVDILGDSLITQPLKSHPCDDNFALPSPNDLKYKILIKNKKLHQDSTSTSTGPNGQPTIRKTDSLATVTSDPSTPGCLTSSSSVQSAYFPNPPLENNVRKKQAVLNEIRDEPQTIEFDSQLSSEINRNAAVTDDDEHSSDDEETLNTPVIDLEALPTDPLTQLSSTGTYPTNSDALAESKATKAMSDLVHYVVPVRFVTFARSEERQRNYEMSSFAEDKAQSLIREHAREFVAYNQRQLSRIYPRGKRLDSSNYNPYLFWPVGCQMVALNYQTMDTPMQVNLGLFSFNRVCGYLEKPASLCQSTGSFDPKGRMSVENVVGYQIEIKLISGQFLCQDREPTYVNIEMYGMYADATKRHEYRLRIKRWNGFQAVYDDTDGESGEFPIRFSKVILPEMASLRFAVLDEDGSFIGQSFIPVAHLRPGYRHVVLRNQMNIPVQSASLFIYIRKDVHVDAEDRELIDQLVSPTSNPSLSKEPPKPTHCKPLSPQRSHSISDLDSLRRSSHVDGHRSNEDSVFSSDNPHRPQFPSTTEINTKSTTKRRNQSTPFVEANWHHNRLIASSQLHEHDRLCQVLSLHLLEQSKTFKREKEKIQSKIRRASIEYEKKIQLEEDRFRKCLSRQQNGTLVPRPLNHWNDSEFNPQVDGRTTSFIHPKMISEEVKQAETRLLDLYSNKFHMQNELEYKYSKEYYNELEKFVVNFYSKQLHRINDILKQEQSKVKGEVRVQMKSETKKTIMTETDREKIVNLKEKIRQMNIEAGALAIRKLQEMHEKLEQTIQSHLQAAMSDLHKARDQETKNRFNKYLHQLKEIKLRLQGEIPGEDSSNGAREHSLPLASRSTISNSTSLTAMSHPTNFMSLTSASDLLSTSPSNHSSRRRTIDSTNIADPSTDDEDDDFLSFVNQATESTRF